MKIVIGTNNKGKLQMIREILKDYDVFSLEEVGIKIDIIENEDTFEGNAMKKAREIFKILHETCIADDTGICIEEFDEWPGVMTDRFLGKKATEDEKNDYIIEKMKDLPIEKRKAKIVTVVVLKRYDGVEKLSRKELNGYIAIERRGNNGFGFDDIFELEDGRTLAELTLAEKNEIGNRRKAVMDVAKYL